MRQVDPRQFFRAEFERTLQRFLRLNRAALVRMIDFHDASLALFGESIERTAVLFNGLAFLGVTALERLPFTSDRVEVALSALLIERAGFIETSLHSSERSFYFSLAGSFSGVAFLLTSSGERLRNRFFVCDVLPPSRVPFRDARVDTCEQLVARWSVADHVSVGVEQGLKGRAIRQLLCDLLEELHVLLDFLASTSKSERTADRQSRRCDALPTGFIRRRRSHRRRSRLLSVGRWF